MALQGTLETFALADVLRLLASTKKTGVLRIDGDRGHGQLSVVDGELVGASASGAPRAERPGEVLFELLRFGDGSFIFDTDAEPSGSHRDNVDEALADAEEQLREWREIEAVIQSPTRVLRLVAERDRDITLTSRQWAAVVAVGSGRTTIELGERLGLPELPAARLGRDLVELGAVKVGEESAPVTPPAATSAPVTEPAPEPEPTPEPAIAPVVDLTPVTAPAPPEPVAEAPPPPPPPAPATPPAPPPAPSVNGSTSFADAPSFITESTPTPPAAPPSAFAPAPDAPSAFAPAPAADPISSWHDDPDDGLSSFHEDDEPSTGLFGSGSTEPGPDDPFGPDPFDIPKFPAPGSAAQSDDAAEMARQLANLSPRAQQAVAAAAAASTDEEREQAIARVADDSDEPINRNLLLKYLSSVDE